MSPAIVVTPRSSPAESPIGIKIQGGKFKLPKLRFEIRDLSHPGAAHFLSGVNAARCLANAAQNVLRLLYRSPKGTLPPCRSVTLILRDMPGVAYTTGSDLDSDHKEIHFSLAYISRISHERLTHELTGVITHEMVHCLQYNGKGTCPGGLIEGIADWVRLKCKLASPHWKQDGTGSWDGGYDKTAYFLDYLANRFEGRRLVQELNDQLRAEKYEEHSFWMTLVGIPVGQLWSDYGEKLRDEEAVMVNKEEALGDD